MSRAGRAGVSAVALMWTSGTSGVARSSAAARSALVSRQLTVERCLGHAVKKRTGPPRPHGKNKKGA
jgi:hypothetical protein